LAGVLASGSAAYANTATTAELHQTNVVLDGSKFDTCEGLVPKDGIDQWVFIWPGDNNNVDGELVALNLTFSGGTRDETNVVGLVGAADSALKVIIETPAGWTLLSGTSQTQHAVSVKVGDTWVFNLTHGCAGGDGGSPSPSPSDTGSPSDSPSPSDSISDSGSPTPGTSSSSGGGGDDGGLPVTGVALGGMLLTGTILVAGGVVLLVGFRRRAAAESAASSE
jgi:hypothetical protein